MKPLGSWYFFLILQSDNGLRRSLPSQRCLAVLYGFAAAPDKSRQWRRELPPVPRFWPLAVPHDPYHGPRLTFLNAHTALHFRTK